MKVIKVDNINKDIDKNALIKMYKSFFTFKKRIPIVVIKNRIKHNRYVLHKYTDNNELIGFSIIYKEQNYVLVHYIVIDRKHHGKGYGSLILQNILDENKEITVFLTCEYFDETTKTPEKENRYRFYLKNNMIKNKFNVVEYGVRYFLMSNKLMSEAEYINTLNNCFNRMLVKLFFKIYK